MTRPRQTDKNNFIYLFPIVYIVHLVAQSYQMDFRVFYVTAHSVLLHLNPYLNPVFQYPELYAASNASYRYESGFIYPPFAALVFAPLGWIQSYDLARSLFSLLILGCLLGCFYLIKTLIQQEQNIAKFSELSLVFALVSLPCLASFERGQIDIFILWICLWGFQFYHQPQRKWIGSALIALATQIKVFPGFLILYFLIARKDWQFGLQFSAFVAGFTAIAYRYFGKEVYFSFLQRSLPQIFGQLQGPTPVPADPQAVIHSYLVMAIQGKYKLLSQDFVNGFMNPLLMDHTLLAIAVGCVALVALLRLSVGQDQPLRWFQALTLLNVINPKSWIMGLVWYFPLYFYYFDRVTPPYQALMLSPLFMPPSLQGNVYLSIAIAFLSATNRIKTIKTVTSSSDHDVDA